MDPDPYESKISDDWPCSDWTNLTVLVGVSGGADSVALLRALARLRLGDLGKSEALGRLVVAHLNHQLRGSQADADEEFVRCLAKDLAIECHAARIGLHAAAQPDGLEAAARHARYEFFTRTAQQVGARYVALAHTRDDQAETILHRIVRGTGIAGLAGMPRTRRLSDSTTLIRPMLETGRDVARAYLGRLGQGWREDASNLDPRFTRNRLRHELLPLLTEKFNPRADEALLRLGRLAGELQGVVDDRIVQLIDAAAKTDSTGEMRLELRPLQNEQPYVLRELFIQVWRRQQWPRQDMSLAHWEDLANMVLGVGDCRQRTFPGEVEVRAADGQLALHRRQSDKNLP